ncbi:ATP-binding protein [Streptomyces piniterrae]|uniref:ATP-binding protein n=1 Tax=Streptomyces piniterrae TaxID=2571125 RepID=A0A4U0MW32_9ACTN|nr:ATP-binding protein [Streptomyces piniterrae]TJZ45270.1 ATP-binding protein [Streptomyces piniterrae]
MSLPVTRRIARAVLLIAAGTAPVVGAAGSANALPLPAKAPGLSNQDKAVADAAQVTAGATNELAKGTVKDIVPATLKTAAKTAGPTVQKLHPAAQQGADTGTFAKNVAKNAAKTAAKHAKPTVHKGSPAAPGLLSKVVTAGGLLGNGQAGGPVR